MLFNWKKLASSVMAASLVIAGTAIPASATMEDGYDDTAVQVEEEPIADMAAETTPVEDSGNTQVDLQDVFDRYQNSDTATTTDAAWDLQNNTGILATTVSGTTVDYYGDDYYDTDGNATLIKEENIIYNSDEMQFIAVTTKDGSVFYVLINYTAEGEEDNVYFLNKVDDYDLYALLYEGDESSEDSASDPSAAAAQAASNANGNNSSNRDVATTTATTDVTATTQNQSTSSNSTTFMLLGIGVVVLAGAGFAFYKFKGKGGKKKSGSDDSFDGFEDDFDDITTDESEDEK